MIFRCLGWELSPGHPRIAGVPHRLLRALQTCKIDSSRARETNRCGKYRGNLHVYHRVNHFLGSPTSNCCAALCCTSDLNACKACHRRAEWRREAWIWLGLAHLIEALLAIGLLLLTIGLLTIGLLAIGLLAVSLLLTKALLAKGLLAVGLVVSLLAVSLLLTIALTIGLLKSLTMAKLSGVGVALVSKPLLSELAIPGKHSRTVQATRTARELLAAPDPPLKSHRNKSPPLISRQESTLTSEKGKQW